MKIRWLPHPLWEPVAQYSTRRSSIGSLSPMLAQRAWVLRFGGLYGPGRHHLLDALRAGESTFPGSGDHWVNLLYRDDAVAAIRVCITANSEIADGIFNVVDNEPVRRKELVSWLAQRLGRDPNTLHFTEAESARSTHRRTSSGVNPDRRISSAKIQKTMDWTPLCHSYKAGYILMLG